MRTRTGRFLKLTIGVELKRRPARSVKIRGPCDDNRDFRPVVKKASVIKPIKVGIGEQGVAHPTKEGGRQGPEEEVAGIRGFEWYHGRKFPAAMVGMYEKMKGPEVVYYYDGKKRRREELLARFYRTGNVIVKLGGLGSKTACSHRCSGQGFFVHIKPSQGLWWRRSGGGWED